MWPSIRRRSEYSVQPYMYTCIAPCYTADKDSTAKLRKGHASDDDDYDDDEGNGNYDDEDDNADDDNGPCVRLQLLVS